MNIKNYLNGNGTAVLPYCEINREERGACAILYHLILKEIENPTAQNCFSRSVLGVTCNNQAQEGNKPNSPMGALLNILTCDPEFIKNTEVYMEYTYLRDLWKTLDGENDKKHGYICDAISNFIQTLLPQANSNDTNILNKFLSTINGFNNGGSIDCQGFNSTFATGNISAKEIQSPSRWGDKKLGDLVRGLKLNDKKLAEELVRKLFEKLLFFKWAFNIKPDIVLCYPNGTAACIEAKFESGIGKYKASHNSGLSCCAQQTDVQQYLMDEILGYGKDNVKYYVLARDKTLNSSKFTLPKNYTGVSWKDAFGYFKGLYSSPAFINKQINNYSK